MKKLAVTIHLFAEAKAWALIDAPFSQVSQHWVP